MYGRQYGQDAIAGMEAFFEHWTKASPLVFVKYEALYDHLKDIEEALRISFHGFAKKRDRKSKPPDVIDERLLSLRGRFEALPEFFISK